MPGMFGGGGMSGEDIKKAAITEGALNRNNVNSPIYGSTNWTQGTDANGNPVYTENQTLSPFMQQRFDLAQKLMGNVGGEIQGFDPNTTNPTMDPAFEQNQADQAFNYQKAFLDPQWAQQEAQMKGQLAAQGLHPGDPGYNQAMTQFQSGKNQAYGTARSGSYATGVQAGATRMNTATQSMQAQIARQLAKSGWSLGQINALMAGLPGAPQGSSAQSSIVQPMLQQSMQNQQLQAQFGNNLVGGLMGGLSMFSDVDAKENFSEAGPSIEEFLESAEPAAYDYKDSHKAVAGEGRYVSPMAQGLEKSSIGRSLVVDTPAGKVVDYGKSFGALLGSLSHLNKKLNSVMGL